MATLEIIVQPTGVETHHETTVVLDEARILFAFFTNTIDGGWYFDISNDDGSSVARGLALAVGTNLLFPYRHLNLAPGTLWVLDKENASGDDEDPGNDPGLAAFADKTHALLYTESVT